jgi:hypothetical protein
MNKLKLWTGISLILLIGMLIGSVGTKMYTRHKIARFIDAPDPPGARILRRLSDKLDLSPPQKEKFEKILDRSLTDWTEFREKYQPEFQNLFDETIAQIKNLLSDEQKQKLDDMYDRLKKRIHSPGDRHPRDRPPTPERFMSALKKRLDLTKAQEAKVLPIINSSMKRQREMLKSLGREMRQHQQSVEDKLGMILNAEQMEKYRRVRARYRPEFRPPR